MSYFSDNHTAYDRHSVGTDAPATSSYYQLKVILDTDPVPVTTFPAYLSDFKSLIRHIKDRVIPLRYPLSGDTFQAQNSDDDSEVAEDDGETLSPTDRHTNKNSDRRRRANKRETIRSSHDTSENGSPKSNRVLSQLFYWDVPLQQYRLLRSLQPIIDNGHQGQLYAQTVERSKITRHPPPATALELRSSEPVTSQSSGVSSYSSSSETAADEGDSRTKYEVVKRSNQYRSPSKGKSKESRSRKSRSNAKGSRGERGYDSSAAHNYSSDAPSSVPPVLQSSMLVKSPIRHPLQNKMARRVNISTDSDHNHFPSRSPPHRPQSADISRLSNRDNWSAGHVKLDSIISLSPPTPKRQPNLSSSVFDVVSPPTVKRAQNDSTSIQNVDRYNSSHSHVDQSRRIHQNKSMVGINLLEADAIHGYLQRVVDYNNHRWQRSEHPTLDGYPSLYTSIALNRIVKIEPSNSLNEQTANLFGKPQMLFLSQNGVELGTTSTHNGTTRQALRLLEKNLKQKVTLMEEACKRCFLLFTLEQDRAGQNNNSELYDQRQRLSVISNTLRKLRSTEVSLKEQIRLNEVSKRSTVITNFDLSLFGPESVISVSSLLETVKELVRQSIDALASEDDLEGYDDNHTLMITVMRRCKVRFGALRAILKNDGLFALSSQMEEINWNRTAGSALAAHIFGREGSLEEEESLFDFKNEAGEQKVLNDPFGDDDAAFDKKVSRRSKSGTGEPSLAHQYRVYSNEKLVIPPSTGLTTVKASYQMKNPSGMSSQTTHLSRQQPFSVPKVPISSAATLALTIDQKLRILRGDVTASSIMAYLCVSAPFTLTLCQSWLPSAKLDQTHFVIHMEDLGNTLHFEDQFEQFCLAAQKSSALASSHYITEVTQQPTRTNLQTASSSMANPLMSLTNRNMSALEARKEGGVVQGQQSVTIAVPTSQQLGHSSSALQNPTVQPAYLLECSLSVDKKASMGRIESSSNLGCPTHDGRPFTGWCRGCHKLICDHCAITTHAKQHDTQFITSMGKRADNGVSKKEVHFPLGSAVDVHRDLLQAYKAINYSTRTAVTSLPDTLDSLVPILFPSEVTYLKTLWDEQIKTYLVDNRILTKETIDCVRTASEDIVGHKISAVDNHAFVEDSLSANINDDIRDYVLEASIPAHPSTPSSIPFNIAVNVLSSVGLHSHTDVESASARYLDSVLLAMNTTRSSIHLAARAVTLSDNNGDNNGSLTNNVDAVLRLARQYSNFCGWEETSETLLPLIVSGWASSPSEVRLRKFDESKLRCLLEKGVKSRRLTILPHTAEIEDLLTLEARHSSFQPKVSTVLKWYNQQNERHAASITSLTINAKNKYQPWQLKRMFNKIQDILPPSAFDPKSTNRASQRSSDSIQSLKSLLGLSYLNAPLMDLAETIIEGEGGRAADLQTTLTELLKELISERISNAHISNTEFGILDEGTRDWLTKTSLLGAAEHRMGLVEKCIGEMEKLVIAASSAIRDSYRTEGRLRSYDDSAPFGHEEYSGVDGNKASETPISESLHKMKRSVNRLSGAMVATQEKILETWRSQVRKYQRQIELEMIEPLRACLADLVQSVECVKELAVDMAIYQLTLQPSTEQIWASAPLAQTWLTSGNELGGAADLQEATHHNRDIGRASINDIGRASALALEATIAHNKSQMTFLAAISSLFEQLKHAKELLLIAEKRFQSTVLVGAGLVDAGTIKNWGHGHNESNAAEPADETIKRNSRLHTNDPSLPTVESSKLLTALRRLSTGITPSHPIFISIAKATTNFTKFGMHSLERIVSEISGSSTLGIQFSKLLLTAKGKAITNTVAEINGDQLVQQFLSAAATEVIGWRIRNSLMPSDLAALRSPQLFLPSRIHGERGISHSLSATLTYSLKPMKHELAKKGTAQLESILGDFESEGNLLIEQLLDKVGGGDDRSHKKPHQGDLGDISSDSSAEDASLQNVSTNPFAEGEEVDLISRKDKVALANRYERFESLLSGHVWIVPDIGQLLSTRQRVVDSATGDIVWSNEEMVIKHSASAPDAASIEVPRDEQSRHRKHSLREASHTMEMNEPTHGTLERTPSIMTDASPSALRGTRPASSGPSSAVRVVSPRSMRDNTEHRRSSIENSKREDRIKSTSRTSKRQMAETSGSKALSSAVLRQHTRSLSVEDERISRNSATRSDRRAASVDARSAVTSTSGVSTGSNGSRKQRQRMQTLKALKKAQPTVGSQLSHWVFGKPKLTKHARQMIFEGKELLLLRGELKEYFERYYNHAIGILSDQYELAKEQELIKLEVNSALREAQKSASSQHEQPMIISLSLPYPLISVPHLLLPRVLSVSLVFPTETARQLSASTNLSTNSEGKLVQKSSPAEKLLKSILRDVNKNQLEHLSIWQLREVTAACQKHIKRQRLTLAATGGGPDSLTAQNEQFYSTEDKVQMARRRSWFGTFGLKFSEHPSAAYIVSFRADEEPTMDARLNNVISAVGDWFCCAASNDVADEDANQVLKPFLYNAQPVQSSPSPFVQTTFATETGRPTSPPPLDQQPPLANDTAVFNSPATPLNPSVSQRPRRTPTGSYTNPRQQRKQRMIERSGNAATPDFGPHETIPNIGSAHISVPASTPLLSSNSSTSFAPKAIPQRRLLDGGGVGSGGGGERSLSAAPSSGTSSRKTIRKKMMPKPASHNSPPLHPAAHPIMPSSVTDRLNNDPQIAKMRPTIFAGAGGGGVDDSTFGTPTSIWGMPSAVSSPFMFGTQANTPITALAKKPRLISANQTPVNSPTTTATLADGSTVVGGGLKGGMRRSETGDQAVRRRPTSVSTLPSKSTKSPVSTLLKRNQSGKQANVNMASTSTTTVNLSTDLMSSFTGPSAQAASKTGESKTLGANESLSVSAVSVMGGQISPVGNATANTSLNSITEPPSQQPLSTLLSDLEDHTPDMLLRTATIESSNIAHSTKGNAAVEAETPRVSGVVNNGGSMSSSAALTVSDALLASSPTFLHADIPPTLHSRKLRKAKKVSQHARQLFPVAPPPDLLAKNTNFKIEFAPPPELYSELFYLCGYEWEIKLTCDGETMTGGVLRNVGDQDDLWVSIYLCPVNHSMRLDFIVIIFGSRLLSTGNRFEIWSEYEASGWSSRYIGRGWGVERIAKRSELLETLASKEALNDNGALKLCIVPSGSPY